MCRERILNPEIDDAPSDDEGTALKVDVQQQRDFEGEDEEKEEVGDRSDSGKCCCVDLCVGCVIFILTCA